MASFRYAPLPDDLKNMADELEVSATITSTATRIINNSANSMARAPSWAAKGAPHMGPFGS